MIEKLVEILETEYGITKKEFFEEFNKMEALNISVFTEKKDKHDKNESRD